MEVSEYLLVKKKPTTVSLENRNSLKHRELPVLQSVNVYCLINDFLFVD